MAEVQVYTAAVDKGLEGIVACTTAVSSIVGDTLNYRGYTIEDLAQNSTFEEVAYLLWNGKLPKKEELQNFKSQISQSMKLPSGLVSLLKQLPHKNVHSMAWLRSAVSLQAQFDTEALNNTAEANFSKSLRLLAQMGTLVCAYESIRNGREIVEPKSNQSLAWNFMYMLTGKEPDAALVKIFDTCLILHADHELNCSAFATRVTASSLSDLHSAIVSAIGALKGPLHGGANEQVMLMLKKIGTIENAQQFVKDALAAKEKVMGIGHRVYKNGDPRARILRKISEELTAKTGQPHLYQMSILIDDTMQKEKGLMPNVDFYSATVYYSMGIPIDLYTPIFAVSRIAGWCAHAFEQYANNRIYRPRGQWTGASGLKWLSIEQR